MSDFKIILNIVLVLSAKKGLTVFEKILFSVKDISIKIFFFYLGYVSLTFMNHRTARERREHSINSSLSPASHTLRH